ncbi:thermonuclease family protein [Chryseobacterium mulctrae]|uniref:thermonuclease family protein n=1 Tax=Chryseobacterium mulctrae TaxID=2576777 RepID=UPI0011168430|nr:thermonuclease family protein [Chryseobacterium mulctrae]
MHIKKYVIGDVPNAAADVISFDLNEVRFKIKDYLQPIKKAKALTTENFLQASRVISLLVDFFLLNKGIYLKTEKSKNKYFFQNFPNEAFGLSTVNEKYLSEEIIRAGLGWWYFRYSANKKLGDLENIARNKKVGLWKDSKMVAPWEFRKLKNYN